MPESNGLVGAPKDRRIRVCSKTCGGVGGAPGHSCEPTVEGEVDSSGGWPLCAQRGPILKTEIPFSERKAFRSTGAQRLVGVVAADIGINGSVRGAIVDGVDGVGSVDGAIVDGVDGVDDAITGTVEGAGSALGARH